jgi:hypothetical protein
MAPISPDASLPRRPQGVEEGARKGAPDDGILVAQSGEMRTEAEAMLRQSGKLACESWNERMWADGEPIDPSPTADQAINGGCPWLQIECSRCRTPRDADLAALAHPADDFGARPRRPAAAPEVHSGRASGRWQPCCNWRPRRHMPAE